MKLALTYKSLYFLAIIWSGIFTGELYARISFPQPESSRITYNLNYDWKFNKGDVTGSHLPGFQDAGWKTVSLPHTYNDIDLFDTWVTGSGNYGWAGKTFYRKHFKLKPELSGKKVFVEFEGIRQAGEFYINGIWVGRHENGVGPCGIDISDYVYFGEENNVLAVRIDNSLGYKEVSSGLNYQWNTPPFHPNYGGIVSNVRLHVTDKLYQTLPLYSNLGTSGVYVYASNISLTTKTADITIESEIQNTCSESRIFDFAVQIIDKNGKVVASDTSRNYLYDVGETRIIKTTLPLSNISFWSPDYPNLYTVHSMLIADHIITDIVKTPLGIRSVAFNVTEGLTINGRFLYLNGYAPRTTMEWVTVGVAPGWLSEYDFHLMKASNGNFIRPMHSAPRMREVKAADKFGIIYACPAGDAEGDATGRQWEHRTELMRDVIIYFRNNPSIVFWEGGNQNITPEHMQEMVVIKSQWDPYGGRFSGTRSTSGSLNGIAEYGSTMDGIGGSSTIPVWDAEYARAECPRRVWDKYSPPSFGYANIADPANNIVEHPVNDFKMNSSEDLARNNIKKYYDRWIRRGGQGLNAVMVGGAKIIFADGCSHGRMIKTELARVSGVTDAARLPKESFYALKVAHSDTMDLKILGHWNYPENTVKDVFVISNMEEIRVATYTPEGQLIKDYGKGTRTNHFEFAFSSVAWKPGKIVAYGYKNGVMVKTQEIITAGPPAKLRLTAYTGPKGFFADGSDIAMFDIEVTDAQGNRFPTDERKINFSYSGEAQFLGGYNSGIEYSIFKDTLLTECGINRVFARSTRNTGSFTLHATASGLESTSVTITSLPITLENGLTTNMPQGYTITPNNPPDLPYFHFEDITDAPLNTEIISAIATVTGIAVSQPIKIVAQSHPASYSINGGSFTTSGGFVSNGDQIRIKITSDSQYATTRYVILAIGSIEDMFTVITKNAPPPTSRRNLALVKPVTASSFQTGNEISRINDGNMNTRWAASTNTLPQSFIIDLSDIYKTDSTEMIPYMGRDYRFKIEGSINGTDYFLMSDQTANLIAGNSIPTSFAAKYVRYVRITITGAATYTGNWASVNEFRIFEASADTIPEQFVIPEVHDAELFSLVQSEPFTINGIDGKTIIYLSENTETASYTVNGGQDMFEPSLVENNDIITIKLGTGSQYATTYTVKVTIGGVSSDFKATTQDMSSDLHSINFKKSLFVFPNPSNGVVNIINEANINMEIYDLSGYMIYSRKLIKGNNQINLSTLRSGVYLIKVISDSATLNYQLMLNTQN